METYSSGRLYNAEYETDYKINIGILFNAKYCIFVIVT